MTHGRTDIARKIQAARELGDLKENGDYHAAKEEQGKMEARIRHLAACCSNAEIVDDRRQRQRPGRLRRDHPPRGRRRRREVPHRLDRGASRGLHRSARGSPLGAALMGRAVGEVVDFEAPGGPLKVEILDIES